MAQELLDYYPPNEDGYTLPAYIKASPMLHKEVRLTFRPTPVEERGVIMDCFRSLGESKSSSYVAEMLASKIKSWNLTIPGPENIRLPMPITQDWILRLKPAIWIRLVSIVIWGTDGGDLDPKLDLEDQLSEVEQQVRAIIDKQRPIDVKVEGELKN
jgi:hypothetical protein